jgi:hypothetical protein
MGKRENFSQFSAFQSDYECVGEKFICVRELWKFQRENFPTQQWICECIG